MSDSTSRSGLSLSSTKASSYFAYQYGDDFPMTSFAIRPFARPLSDGGTRLRLRPSLAPFRRSAVNPYRAAATREQGLAAAVVGSWPLGAGLYRSGL
jgi:hypothetical protein